MQIQLSPDFPDQYHPETGQVVASGAVTDIADRALAVSLLEQVDKWLPVGQVKPPTVAEVLAEVGDDSARAAAALEAEKAGKNRASLITKLEAIASSNDDTQDGED